MCLISWNKLYIPSKVTEIDPTKPWDIEDLVKNGRRETFCPFFTAKMVKSDVEIIFAPYNYLLDKGIRTQLGIKILDIGPQIHPKSTKLGPNIHKVGFQNPPSWAPESRKMSLGGTLEGSWGHLGPKIRPRPKYTSKTNFWGPLLAPFVEAKNFLKSIF